MTTMIPISSAKPEVTFEKFSRAWFHLLSCADFANAAHALDEPNSYGQIWSGEEILQVILDYVGERSISVSDPAFLPRDPYQNTGAFRDGSGFYYNCSVPLGGQWSDLTAQFEFLRRPAGFAVILDDIRVQ